MSAADNKKSVEERLAELEKGHEEVVKGQADLKTEVAHLQADARRQRLIVKKLPGMFPISLVHCSLIVFI